MGRLCTLVPEIRVREEDCPPVSRKALTDSQPLMISLNAKIAAIGGCHNWERRKLPQGEAVLRSEGRDVEHGHQVGRVEEVREAGGEQVEGICHSHLQPMFSGHSLEFLKCKLGLEQRQNVRRKLS